MKFYEYIKENTDIKKQWQRYIKTNKMLQSGVSVLNIIEKMGYKAYIVGGSVRDIVLGINPKDIDIATNCPIDILETKFKTYDIGKSKDFGIVVINQGGFQYEIAQFRKDGSYRDGRRPESVSITGSFKDDTERRDFRINAMGIDKDGNIIDYFDGIKDIKNKVIRTVGDPDQRFGEDYLRMIRAVRFASRLDFDIDDNTKKSIMKHKEKLPSLSPERIKDELWKMASQPGDKFAKSLVMLDELGILDIILPEISKLKTTKETPDHHPEAYIDGGDGSVFNHVLAAITQNKLKDPIINLSILLHDVGKPSTHKQIGGKHTYHGHAEAAKEIIDNIAKRLRLSNREKDSIMFAAINHMKLFKGSNMKPSKIIKLINDENWAVLKAVSYCDDSCRGKLFDRNTFDSVISDMEEISKKWGDKTANKVSKVVDGDRVMKLTGISPGKMVGSIIKLTTEYVIDNNIKSDSEIDKLVIRFYKELK